MTVSPALPAERLSLCSDGVGQYGPAEAGDGPHGTAHRWDVGFAIEATPRRWDAMRDSTTWGEPQRTLFARIAERVKEAGIGYGLLMFAPGAQPDSGHDPELFRVRVYRRPAGPFRHYAQTDYQVNEAGLWQVMASALLGDVHPELESARVESAPGTDWHICTHGRVDAACGKFGVPLQATLAAAGSGERVWRTSHFGGHRFAPTMQELPSGRTWAHLTPELVTRLMARRGDHLPLAARLRGTSALDRWAQVADAHAFARIGWAWLDAAREVQTAAEQDRAIVRFSLPDAGALGLPPHLTAEVWVSHEVLVRGSSHKPETSAAPQYSLRWLELESV